VIVELKRCPWCNCHALSLEITELQYKYQLLSVEREAAP
jgi:hypothetical protein